MYVCMYVCMYLSIYIYICIYVYIRTSRIDTSRRRLPRAQTQHVTPRIIGKPYPRMYAIQTILDSVSFQSIKRRLIGPTLHQIRDGNPFTSPSSFK